MTPHLLTKDITLFPGDGVGPEIMHGVRDVLTAVGAPLTYQSHHNVGATAFDAGIASGLSIDAIVSLKQTKIVLKGPLTTPIGYGEKSANVSLRKLCQTFANVRPVKSIPGIQTPYQNVDFIIVRENLEDLYAGIEHQQTYNVRQALKIITRQGSEKIIRFAFELAVSQGRHKVTCVTKANILKMTEGFFLSIFNDIATEYPQIEAQTMLVDNAAHQMVRNPQQFDVMVMTNMNGDILSDLGSGLVGGLGFAPSANIGDSYAIFEPVHGSAPKHAGKNSINPTAGLLAAVMMLRHLGYDEHAQRIEQALYDTLSQKGMQTRDTDPENGVSTTAFIAHIINNLDKNSRPLDTSNIKPLDLSLCQPRLSSIPTTQSDYGVDVFIETKDTINTIATHLNALAGDFDLQVISHRGLTVYDAHTPMDPHDEFYDMVMARFKIKHPKADVHTLLQHIDAVYQWCHVERLQLFDDTPGFSN